MSSVCPGKRTMLGGLLLVLCLAGLPPGFAQAGQEAAQETRLDEEQQARRIKADIMRELRDGDWLAQQIEQGIEKYVQKQLKIQEAAREQEARKADEKAKHVRRVSPTRDHIRGNPGAEISLIEYSDFECPFCKQFHATAKELVDTSAGNVNWVYRHLPLAMHAPSAHQQAEAAECAGEVGGAEAFWAYADAIFVRTTSNGHGFPKDKLVPLAEELGLKIQTFEECLTSKTPTARIKEDLTEAEAVGVTSTPGNILVHNQTGEVKLLLGAVPLETLRAAARQLRDRASQDGQARVHK